MSAGSSQISLSGPRSAGSSFWWRLQRRSSPYLFVLPFIVVFLVFMLYPLLQSIRYAFLAMSGPGSVRFVGLDNIRFLFSDGDFWIALRNTAVFACCSVFLQLPMSLGFALLVHSRWLKGRNFFRFALFSPYLMGLVFTAVLFRLVFMPRYGLLNKALHAVTGHGLDTKWLLNESLVMPAIVLAAAWMYVGFNMIFFLAALQAVDRGLYDVAAVDGANKWQQFLHVTLPGIKPVAAFVVLMSTIGSFQLFELAYVLLENTPGPNNSGLFIVVHLYRSGFRIGDLGYASAIGWVLVVIILSISLIQARVAGFWRREA